MSGISGQDILILSLFIGQKSVSNIFGQFLKTDYILNVLKVNFVNI